MGLRPTCPLSSAHVLQVGETYPQWVCRRQGRGMGCRGCSAYLLHLRALGLVILIVSVHRTQVAAGRILAGPWLLIALLYLCWAPKFWLCCSVVNSNKRKDRFFCVGSLCFFPTGWAITSPGPQHGGLMTWVPQGGLKL